MTDRKPLNLVLLISSFHPWTIGEGGHYYSAMTVAEKLSALHSVRILNVGDFPAPALSKSSIQSQYIYIDIKRRLGVDRTALLESLAEYNPDVVIAFDSLAGTIVRRLCINLRCGFVLVKPGGGIPKGYYQNNPFQIHFSLKDLHWASERTHYKNGKVACIPNRVAIPEQDWQKIEKLKQQLSIQSNEIVLIRISRITRAYEKSFLAAIELAKFLRTSGYPTRLIIVGICQDTGLLRELEQLISEQDAVLTSEEFTKKASCILEIAHINIGVGRGFMEGCATGQHMLASNQTDSLPTVVNDSNFEAFFKENFSMRVNFKANPAQNRKAILEITENCLKDRETKSHLSKNWFEKHFSEDQIPKLYGDVLYSAKSCPEEWTLDAFADEVRLNGKLNIGAGKLFERIKKIVRR